MNRKLSRESTCQLYGSHFVNLGYIFCSKADKNAASHEHRSQGFFPEFGDFPNNYETS